MQTNHFDTNDPIDVLDTVIAHIDLANQIGDSLNNAITAYVDYWIYAQVVSTIGVLSAVAIWTSPYFIAQVRNYLCDAFQTQNRGGAE